MLLSNGHMTFWQNLSIAVAMMSVQLTMMLMLLTRRSSQCQPLMAFVSGCMGRVQQSHQVLLMQGKSNGCRQWL
jgi:hypothetical protein